MIVTLSTEKLKDILELVVRFVAKHSTLPILENVYIKADIDQLIFKATDMEKYIDLTLPAQIDAEWSITVNAKMFLDILRSIDEEEVKLIIDEEKQIMNIKTSSDDFKIKWIAASEYVALPSVDSEVTYKINVKDFIKWVEKVYMAVTEKAFSPVLTWVLVRLKSEEKKLVFVWTDSFRLAEYKIDYNWDLQEDIDVIIPKVNIQDIVKVFDFVQDNEGEEVEMKVAENLVSFSAKINDIQITVASLLIQWEFPNYENENIIPTQYNIKVVVDKNILEKAIKKVVILTQSENYFVEMKIEDWKIIVGSWMTDLWESLTQIPASVEWDTISLGINGKYILDFIKSIDWENLSINIVSEEKPVVFKDLDDLNYTYVVRPLVK